MRPGPTAGVSHIDPDEAADTEAGPVLERVARLLAPYRTQLVRREPGYADVVHSLQHQLHVGVGQAVSHEKRGARHKKSLEQV